MFCFFYALADQGIVLALWLTLLASQLSVALHVKATFIDYNLKMFDTVVKRLALCHGDQWDKFPCVNCLR